MANKTLFFLAVLALCSALMMDQARACICTTVVYTLCQKYDMANVVVHAEVVSGSETSDNVTYALDPITYYKGENETSVTTPASVMDCGVTLTINEEYLLGLRDTDDDGVYTISACHGLYEVWSDDVEDQVTEC